MLPFLGLPGHYGESFLYNGGIATLESYDDRRINARRGHRPHLPHRVMSTFCKSLETSHLRPPLPVRSRRGSSAALALEDQDAEDMLWIRQEFIAIPHDLGHTVIFGHTPMRDVMIDLPYKIGLDTGLVYGGKLSCVEFTEGRCLSGQPRQR